MTTKMIVLRRGVASATIETNTAVHSIRAASYECVQAKGGLTISFELHPTGTSARREAAEVFEAPIRKVSLVDLRIQKRLLGFLKEINFEGQSWWVEVRLGGKSMRHRVALVLSLVYGIEMRVVEEAGMNESQAELQKQRCSERASL